VTDVELFESVMAERLGPHAIIKVEGEYVQPAMRLALIAWQASRRAALEEAWAICNANAAKLKGPKETASGYVALVLTADDIRALAKETNNG
jgi:hypothetical protein